jgi:hypothetical protein
MKRFFIALVSFIFMTSTFAQHHNKPRVIVTTDGEIDDQSSMVRFLLYASDYDIAGIVQVNGVQKDGHSKEQWIEKQIEKYAACLPNLRKNNPDYPDASYLLSVVKVGNENREDMHKAPPLLYNSEGAELIIKTLLDNDPRPVHILAWGGANTQANALWQIKQKYAPEDWQKAVAKARLYCIWYQDGGGKWIEENLPEIKIYEAGSPERDGGWRYVWDYMSVDHYYKNRLSKNPPELQRVMDKSWLARNIKTGHGPLCAAYPQDYTSEGDTPSFMPLINNGLEQDTDYTLGGWGGRPVYIFGNHMQDGSDDHNGKPDSHYTFQRWLTAAQNDFAARADWCVKSYKEVNHPPLVKLRNDLNIQAKPGSKIQLSAKVTFDPDGDKLQYKWWQYKEADTFDGNIEIRNAGKRDASFTVPEGIKKEATIHVVCEVTDNGTPQLTRYQRIVITVKP